MAEKQQPGMMLYFDALRPTLERLNDAQAGALLRMLMDYAQYGVVPQSDDPLVDLSAQLFLPRLDRDRERYQALIRSRQYSAYVRWSRGRGEKPLSQEEWERENDANAFFAMRTMPTTTTTSTTASTSTTAPTSTPDTTTSSFSKEEAAPAPSTATVPNTTAAPPTTDEHAKELEFELLRKKAIERLRHSEPSLEVPW